MENFKFNNIDLQQICDTASQRRQDQLYKLQLVNDDIKNLNYFCKGFIGSRDIFKCRDGLFLKYDGERIIAITTENSLAVEKHLASSSAVIRLELQKYFAEFLKFYIEGGL